jgi:hypothetical protein
VIAEIPLDAELGYLDEATVGFDAPEGAASLRFICSGRLFGHGYML